MKLIVMLFLYTLILSLIAFLTDWCLCRWKRMAAGSVRRLWIPLYVLLSLLPLSDVLLPDLSLKHGLQAAGNVFLGFVLYYGALVALLLLLGLLLRLLLRFPLRAFSVPGSGFYGAVLCLSALTALGLFVYGLIHAQRPRVVSYELSVEKEVPEGAKKEMTLVLLADLHLGVNSRLSLTKRMVELVNEQEPDVVVIAGDIFNSCYQGLSHPEDYAGALRGIEAGEGVYAVYGNHDVEEALLGGFSVTPVSEAYRSREMEEFCVSSGFTVLEDEAVILPNGLQIFGRKDAGKAGDGTKQRLAAGELLPGADRSLPVLVLEHEPIEFRELSEAGADAVLSGHTHAGQFFPGNLIVPFFNENPWGCKEMYGVSTIVTAGVGYYGPPMRVGTDSEVTVVRLRFR